MNKFKKNKTVSEVKGIFTNNPNSVSDNIVDVFKYWNVSTKSIHLKILNRKVFEKVKRKMLSSAAADDKRKKTLPENDNSFSRQGYE